MRLGGSIETARKGRPGNDAHNKEEVMTNINLELADVLNELADAFKGQTQEQYNSMELCKRIETEAFPIAYKIGGETWKKVNTIWYSSRMADKTMTALGLELLATLLYIQVKGLAPAIEK